MDMTKCTTSRPFDQKEKIRCMFCRGSSCNRCGITAYLTQTNPALEKLHSSWIDDNILAMQRPHDALFKDSNLIEQFKDNNIVAVFNLTEPGEHPYCGHGNLKTSGFPYQPELLMAAGSTFFQSFSVLPSFLFSFYFFLFLFLFFPLFFICITLMVINNVLLSYHHS